MITGILTLPSDRQQTAIPHNCTVVRVCFEMLTVTEINHGNDLDLYGCGFDNEPALEVVMDFEACHHKETSDCKRVCWERDRSRINDLTQVARQMVNFAAACYRIQEPQSSGLAQEGPLIEPGRYFCETCD